MAISKKIFCMVIAVSMLFMAWAAHPMSTVYSYSECEGSSMPYSFDVKPQSFPDSLQPVLINHVGRHGARYPSSATNYQILKRALDKAQDTGCITQLGKSLSKTVNDVLVICDGKWGALDSLGEYEQRMLASRMYSTFMPVFQGAPHVNAISSYSPRAMMSMYCFTHQLDRLNNKIEFATSSGRQESPLMRPFDLNEDFIHFVKSEEVNGAYKKFVAQTCPISAIERVLGKDFAYSDDEQKRSLALAEYHALASLSAMSYSCDLSDYFTIEEINALWACSNLRHYLQRTATTLSSLPADIAAALVENIIQTTDDFIDKPSTSSVWLRFGHAETIMPLVSLLRLPGCYYLTNYFDTVAKNWRDFDVVPMAANVHFILFQNTDNGRYYLRIDLNEKPLRFIPNSDALYVPWEQAKTYMLRCLTY